MKIHTSLVHILFYCLVTTAPFITFTTIHAETRQKNTLRLGLPAGFIDHFPLSEGVIYSHTFPYELFKEKGFTIIVREFPARRLPIALKSGQIDCILGIESLLENNTNTMMRSRHPTSRLTWYIYHKNTWQPNWPPDEEFRHKFGKSKDSSDSLREEYNLNVTHGPSYDSMVKMVNLGRADYWIDSGIGFRTVTPGLIKSEQENFSIKSLLKRNLYVYFNKTQRALNLLAIYNKSYMNLLQKGDYAALYYKNASNFSESTTTEDTIQFIRSTSPNLSIPDQKPASLIFKHTPL